MCQVALAHIEQTEVGHVRYLSDQLRRMEGVTVYGPPGNRPRVAVLAFNIDGIPATQVGDMLDADHHVCVRAGLHCAPLVHQDRNTVEQMGAVRISPGYFTDEQDIQQVLAGVADIAGIAVPS